MVAATVLKALVEIALAFCVGRAIVALFAGKGRETNAVFQLFNVVLKPVFAFTRFITPKLVVDRHVPIVAFLLLVWVFLAATQLKLIACTGEPEHTACSKLQDKRSTP